MRDANYRHQAPAGALRDQRLRQGQGAPVAEDGRTSDGGEALGVVVDAVAEGEEQGDAEQ